MSATNGAFTETFVEAAGLRIQLRRGGDGPPLLILHGELGVPGWLSAYAQLARDFTVYVPAPASVIGSSLGGWVAAEIAIVNSALFAKQVLVAPAGVPPDEGQIWDYFLHSTKDAFARAFADPAGAPEYARFYGEGWTPEDDR